MEGAEISPLCVLPLVLRLAEATEFEFLVLLTDIVTSTSFETWFSDSESGELKTSAWNLSFRLGTLGVDTLFFRAVKLLRLDEPLWRLVALPGCLDKLLMDDLDELEARLSFFFLVLLLPEPTTFKFSST